MKRVKDYSTRSRVILLLIRSLGVIISLILLFSVIYIFVSKNKTKEEFVHIIVAKKNISLQQPISTDMLSLQDYPKGSSPINGIMADKVDSIVGKKALLSIQAGDVINGSMIGLTNGTNIGGVSNLIPTGKRVVYIKNDDVHSFPPDIQKHNYIDIIAVNQKIDSNNTDVVAEHIEVFDVTHTQENNTDIVKDVGLLLDNDQIVHLSSKFTSAWKLSISLRPQSEDPNKISPIHTASAEGTLDTTNEKKNNQ